MKNEILQNQAQKKKKIFIVKEKQLRKKSSTIQSPTHNRTRRNTEPVLSKLAKLRRELRQSQENIMRNQIPPYPSQNRQRAASIPSYQHYQPSYPHTGSFDQINSLHNPYNPIYSSHYQPQAPSSSQHNTNPNYPNQLLNQNSSNTSSTQLTSSSLTSPTQSAVPAYNPSNQRISQQHTYPYSNPQPQANSGNNKNLFNSSTNNSFQNNVKQQNIQQIHQMQYDNNAAKNLNSHASPYVKQASSCANSMSSSTNAPYSNSSQQDCDNSIYQDKVPPYNTSAPIIQKSNSWCAIDQRYPDSSNIYNEPPAFQHTQSAIVPPYTNQGDQYNPKYSSQYSHPQSNQYNYHNQMKANTYPKGSQQYNNQYNGYGYINGESQQIQNTPSTIASRTSQSPQNAGMIDSFEHGQNMYHQENIEQGLQDFFIDRKLDNELENEDIYASSNNQANINNNNYIDDLFDNNDKNYFDDENDMNNGMNQFNSSTNQHYNMLSSNIGDYNTYPEYS